MLRLNLKISIQTLFLLYLQQGLMIINRNLLRDESLAPEKLCTALFGRGRLKITMKRHITQATRTPRNSRPRAEDCMRLD